MYSEPMYLHYFTQNTPDEFHDNFPFYIQDGHHDEDQKYHHHADFCELVIVLDGTAKQQINEQTYFIKRGDVFVLGDKVSHRFIEPNKLHICNIMFQPSYMFENCHDLRQLPGFHALFFIEPNLTHNNAFKSYLTLNFNEYDEITRLLNQIYKETQKRKPGGKNLIFLYFQMLATYLARSYEMPTKDDDNYHSFCIAKSVSYMEEHFREELTIRYLAEKSHMSERHFMRLFSETYHTSPRNYLIQLRMNHACTLLRAIPQTLTITDIAYESGFQSNNYFSRAFHQMYGMSPREYREHSLTH